MKILSAFIFFTFFLDINSALKDGICKTRMKEQIGNAVNSFPSLEQYAKGVSFEMNTELNNPNNVKPFHIKEAFNYIDKNGLIEIDGEDRYIYSLNEKRVLRIRKGDCQTSQDIRISFLEKLNIKDIGHLVDLNNKFLGVAALLEIAFNLAHNEKNTILLKEKEIINAKNKLSKVYFQCNDAYPDRVYKFYFLDDDTPVKIIITDNVGANEQVQTLNIYHVKKITEDKLFAIPLGLGCDGLEQNVHLPKNVLKSYMIMGEVVYDENAPQLITNFQKTVDHASGLISLDYSDWKIDNKAAKDLQLRRVVNPSIDTVTILNKVKKTCEIKSEKYEGDLKLPDFVLLQLSDNNIFGHNHNFQDMGNQYTERGFPVRVFEKVVNNFQWNKIYERGIITWYFLEKDVSEAIDEKITNMPIKVELRLFEKSEKVQKTITVNIYTLTEHVTNKQDLFNVEPCYVTVDQYTWFQVLFPIPEEMINLAPRLEEVPIKFFDDISLQTKTTPDRLPVVHVDYSNKSVVITAKILQKTPNLLEFDEIHGSIVTEVDDAIFPLSLEECGARCVEFDHNSCSGFSYCGKTCLLTSSDRAPVKDNLCQFYENKYKNSNAKTMKQVLNEIQSLAETRMIKLNLPLLEDDLEPIQLFSSKFSAYIPIPIEIDERFVNVGYGVKYVQEKDQTRTLGPLSYEKCKEACLVLEECFSFSFCPSECTLSTKFMKDVTEDLKTSDSSCGILDKTNLFKFNKNLGVINVKGGIKVFNYTDEEGCAALCLEEKTFKCSTFDFCSGTCFLNDSTNQSDNITQSDAEGQKCIQYTANHRYDFKQELGKRIKREGDWQMNDIGITKCWDYCVKSTSFDCVEFDYCVDKLNEHSSCILISQTDSEIETVDNSFCIRNIKRKIEPKVPNNGIHNSGLAGGLAFLFLLIGLVSGCLIILGYGYYKTRK